MSIVSVSVRRPVTVLMATVALVLFGGISLDRLGLNLLPELTYPTLTIRTEFEGAAPAEVEEQITRRIEQRVGVIGGVRRMHSISAAGRSDVVLEFLWGTNMDLAAIEVREKLDLVQLPLDIERPSLLRLNPSLDPIYRIALTRSDTPVNQVLALQTLRRFADDFIKRRLDPVDGVAAVIVGGGFEDEISVQVDQEQLARLDITVEQLGQRLRNTNVNLSGGRLTDGTQEYLVRTVNEFRTVEDIRQMIIFQRGGRILRLGDVAEVIESQKERDSIMRVNGREAIELSLYKEGDANTVSVAANIREALEDVEASMPANFELVTIYDQSEFISSAIREVRAAAIQGAFLAVLVLFLFLRDLRSTLIVTATIPASVMVTFALMDSSDITLNVMSLGGIALAVGMLMDNAIVVLENIARHRSEGASREEAAEEGATEVGGAVLAATATTIAVFLPLAFVEGIAGQLFRDQALTVTFALLASLVLAFTLIPMLAAAGGAERDDHETAGARGGLIQRAIVRLLAILMRLVLAAAAFVRALVSPVLQIFDRGYGWIESAYPVLLRHSLDRRSVTLLIAIVAFAGSMLLVPRLPMELIPPLSQGEFRVDFELSPGSRIESTDAALLEAQLPIIDDPSVLRTYSVAGTGGRLDARAVSGGENVGELNVTLDAVSPELESRVTESLRARLADVPDAQFTIERPQLFTFSTPLEVEVFGTELEAIAVVSGQIVERMAASSRFADVESSMRAGYPEIQIRFDQDRAAALGLDVPEVAQRVVNKVRGDVPTEFTLQDKKIDIRVRVDEENRNSIADVESIVVNPEAERQVRLGSVASVSLGVGPADIQRIGQSRVAVISATVPDGDLAGAAEAVASLLDEVAMPAGVDVEIGGQNEEMEASFNSLRFALLLALILVYLVMASLFESLLHPFVIMFTIPLAGVGAVLGLVVTGTSISVVVFIGLILLVGIVVNNAIVLIDRVNQLRAAGREKREALIEGAAQRLRPILMTTMTTVLGLTPMALGFGEAAELRTPMAVTVIGGLLVSTALTLIVIPVVYDLLDREQSGAETREDAAT